MVAGPVNSSRPHGSKVGRRVGLASMDRECLMGASWADEQ